MKLMQKEQTLVGREAEEALKYDEKWRSVNPKQSICFDNRLYKNDILYLSKQKSDWINAGSIVRAYLSVLRKWMINLNSPRKNKLFKQVFANMIVGDDKNAFDTRWHAAYKLSYLERRKLTRFLRQKQSTYIIFRRKWKNISALTEISVKAEDFTSQFKRSIDCSVGIWIIAIAVVLILQEYFHATLISLHLKKPKPKDCIPFSKQSLDNNRLHVSYHL